MLKVFSLIKRREDLSLEEFREWVFERHAPMGKELPGLREYHVSVVEQDDPELPYHAVTELYFDDEDAFKAAFASDAGEECLLVGKMAVQRRPGYAELLADAA